MIPRCSSPAHVHVHQGGTVTSDAVRPERGTIRSANLPTHRGIAVRLPPLLVGDDALATWHRRLASRDTLIVLDLFCGAGGMSLGFDSEGFFTAAAIDSEPMACETFAANFPAHVRCHDLSTVTSAEQARAIIRDLGLPRVDVVIGGPPCQGFSIGGRSRIRTLPNEEHRQRILQRNDLYRPFFHFVEAARPLMFVMENVSAIKSWEDGSYFADILNSAARIGYDTLKEVLNAADFGVPQIRRRQFLVGSRIGRVFRFPTPRPVDPVTLLEAIGDLPTVQAPSLEETRPYCPRQTGPYQQLMRSRVPPAEQALIHDHVVRPVREDDRDVFRAMQPGHRYIDIDPRYHRYRADTFKDKYYMLRPDEPCVTITAHLAKDGYRYIHWDVDQCRTISVREAARIQSFDDAFRFAGHRTNRYRQIGNAVPPLLAREIAVRVRRAIRGPWQLSLPWYESAATADPSPETATAR
jgi:DNA (cytosine-5)-methyltransferase 1